MNASGTLTCPRCGTETQWPMRCDCKSPSDPQRADKERDLEKETLEIPDGWQIVPKEATFEMQRAGAYSVIQSDARSAIYKAMLSAAPRLVSVKEFILGDKEAPCATCNDDPTVCSTVPGESDTPRTDKAASLIQYAVVGEQYAVVTAEFARELERESANLAKAYVAERDALLQWKARALEAERPTARSAGTRIDIDEPTAMLLAAISTACVQNTRESAKERIGKSNPYWTAAYGDVCDAVDREMEQRERAEEAEALLRAQSASERTDG